MVGLCEPSLYYFLMFRGLWRHLAWARLLRKIARLELRLVATHPDGKGGLGFLAQYPNAYMFFVFGMSSLIAAALAKNLIQHSISMAAFSTVMAGWLAVVIVVFALPLSAFSPPLARLKQQALDRLGAEATRYHRSAERKQLGRNVVANSGGEVNEGLTDQTKLFETTRKLSSVLVSRTAIVPVAAAGPHTFRDRRCNLAAGQGSRIGAKKVAASVAGFAHSAIRTSGHRLYRGLDR